MYIKEILENEKIIKIAIPLTNGTGKTRIKERKSIAEYGKPVATRTNPFTNDAYVEWQIGYDAKTKDADKTVLSTLSDKRFIGSSDEEKCLYELSEYVYYFTKWRIISTAELLNIKNFLSGLSESDFLDNKPELAIKRKPFENEIKNGLNFLASEVAHPLLIYTLDSKQSYIEIEIKEKQYAIGTQPMLYFCFPVSEFDGGSAIIGRTSQPKEFATFSLGENDKRTLFELLSIFGTLTEKHNTDVIRIIDLLLEEF